MSWAAAREAEKGLRPAHGHSGALSYLEEVKQGHKLGNVDDLLSKCHPNPNKVVDRSSVG